MPDATTIETDLMVIGSGMAGMAASLFAAQRCLDTVQVGITGEINFASGLFDLLGVHPVSKGIRLHDPWDGIRQLVIDEPRHPYVLVKTSQIETAMTQCLDFLHQAGLPYTTNGRKNVHIVTPVGTVKTTYAVPQSMFAGTAALANRTPTLLVDFFGLKGFSARQIIENLGPAWPDLRCVRVSFPNARGELYAEHAARILDVKANRKALAVAIQPHLGSSQAIGLPAVLGVYRTQEIVADLSRELGRPIFEIPTMVPAITGLRLRETFEQRLTQLGIHTRYQQKVINVEVLPDGGFEFLVGDQTAPVRIKSKKAILASGRFFGKGLKADRLGIRETLFNLPVHQPAERTQWHEKDLLHAEGHRINRSGLCVDSCFRPMDAHGAVIHHNLYAAGSILAHQDWTRQKCGSGLSIATAYGAVNALAS